MLSGSVDPPYTSYKSHSSTEAALGYENHPSPHSAPLCPFLWHSSIVRASSGLSLTNKWLYGQLLPPWTKGHGEKAESLHTEHGNRNTPL